MFTNSTRIKKFTSILILLSSAIWIMFSRVNETHFTSESNSAPFVGFKAPDFEVSDDRGESILLSDYKGTPVLLNYWASWCLPCRVEMPAMERIYQEFKEQGFDILAVNSTSQDIKSNALEFADELNLSFPILFDETGSVAKQYKIRALPSSYFIDPNGMIQEVVVGVPMSEALLRIRVKKLLEGE